MKKKFIGVLGGIGPEASSYLYKNILAYCQKKYGAVQDNDYPHMLINNIGLDGFDETGIVNEELVKAGLLEGIHQLDKAGVDEIYIACNTVHTYYEFLQKNSEGNIVNLVENTCNIVKKQGHNKVLILGSNTTNKIGLYDRCLEKEGISYLKINNQEQEELDNIIEDVMGGTIREKDYLYIEDISKKYKKIGATGVIIGCTELPLVTRASTNVLEVFDTIEILTEMISRSVKD